MLLRQYYCRTKVGNNNGASFSLSVYATETTWAIVYRQQQPKSNALVGAHFKTFASRGPTSETVRHHWTLRCLQSNTEARSNKFSGSITHQHSSVTSLETEFAAHGPKRMETGWVTSLEKASSSARCRHNPPVISPRKDMRNLFIEILMDWGWLPTKTVSRVKECQRGNFIDPKRLPRVQSRFRPRRTQTVHKCLSN